MCNKNEVNRMHNSELRLHLNCAFDNLCLFTHGVQNTYAVIIVFYKYMFTCIYIYVYIYVYIYILYMYIWVFICMNK